MKTGWLAWECVVFAVFIFGSAVAPLIVRKKDKLSSSDVKRAYIFAGGGVSTLSMILSVARGTLGVRSFLGFPSELVYRGSAMWETLYGVALAFPFVCWVFVPVYYRLQTNSVYEYLRMRFNSQTIRRVASATFVLRQVLNMAVTVYTPTVALHAVVGLPHWASAAALTAVAIVFNLLGGLAAAIRADVIQTLTMILISGAFMIQATVKAGGPATVLQENIEGDRLQFFKFHGDATVRVDTLSAIIGQLFMSISIYGCQQTFVQRYCSMSSEARVRRTLFANVPAVAVLFSLSWVVGMALYAVYKYCDPLANGSIAAPDEVLPYYVQDQFAFLPGMLGLFLASLFNGALSFMVSNVNSLATVTWEDFVSAAPAFKGISDKQQLTIIKILGVLYSLLIMALSLGVGLVGGVVEGSLLVTSATSGALLGVFLLAALFPPANGTGALMGMIASHVLTIWMAVGRVLYVDNDETILPLSTKNCPNQTTSFFTPKPLPVEISDALKQISPLLDHNTTDVTPNAFESSGLYTFYAISYMWYAVIGTITCVVVGVIVGYLTGKDSDAFDERLLHPVAAKIARMLPGPTRRFTLEKKEKTADEKDSSEKTDETVVGDDAQNNNDVTIEKEKVTNTAIKETMITSKADASKIASKNSRSKAGLSNNNDIKLTATNSRLFDAYEVNSSPNTIYTVKL